MRLGLNCKVLCMFQAENFSSKVLIQVTVEILQTYHARTTMVKPKLQNSAQLLRPNTLSTPKIHNQCSLKA